MLFAVTSINSQQIKEEFRAVWLTNVASTVLTTDQNIVEAMDYLASININVVFPVVYNKGYTLYPSAIMDSLFGVPVLPENSYMNRDYLERLTIEAHRNGIEVIPWFEFGFSSSYSQNGGHIVAEFPEWAAKNSSGNLVVKNGFDWLAGTNPEVQDYMLSLMLEVLDNYDVDGVQGDDRLPAMPVEGGYDEVTVNIYKSEHDGNSPPTNKFDTSWMKWRADKLTEYLARWRDSVKSRNENYIMSVSPTPYYWGYREYLQDSKAWAQQNLLDNIVPQLYQYDMSNYNYALNQTYTDVGQYDPEDFFAGVLMQVGSYVISESLLEDMLFANRNKLVRGESFFFYEGLRNNNNALGEYLKSSFYQDEAIIPYRNGYKYRPKANLINEDDDKVTRVGEWEIYPIQGFEGAIIRTNSTDPAALEYILDVPFEAYFDVYTYRTPNTPWTKNAKYIIHSDEGDEEIIVDQSNLQLKGWHKIGTAKFSEGLKSFVTLDNSLLENGKYLVADAVMIMINRKLSPDVIVSVEDSEKEITQNVPSKFMLEQNYPNPFNPTTSIEYSVPSSEYVSLKVYDVLGNEVASLVNENKTAGSYRIDFNASTLSSGVYFYKITAGNYTETKKMMLIK
ncbi:MAG: family 10 glycosylhydrolase [Melioribacteraceae bacterium]|nr:family 10 glycosylhydrolase [Melioribacteraceae bacterium]